MQWKENRELAFIIYKAKYNIKSDINLSYIRNLE